VSDGSAGPFEADHCQAGVSCTNATICTLEDALAFIAPPVPDSSESSKLESFVCASPILGPIVERWTEIGLPDCWLVAGAIAQTVWNAAFGLPRDHGLEDVDLVYFDDSDLSAIEEDRHERRIRHLFAHLSVKIDVKNEARVHLWYSEKFGKPIAPYTSATHAITTFPTTATSIGIQPGASGFSIAAPYGLSDLFGLIVRPNKVQITRTVYETKVSRWRSLWTGLTIIDW
jgi:hypothetical protein